MGIFNRWFRGRDAPRDSTAGSSYRFFFGGTTSGKTVTERSAMQMTAVYSCVRILAEAIAGLPLHLYRYGEDGSKEKAIDHPLYALLHDEPNPEMTSFVFRETLMTHLLLWGNAYAQIIRNGKGEVVALYPLMPNRMTVDRDERGQLYYEYWTSQDDAHTMKGSVVRLSPRDVLHVPGLGFDGLVGYSPIAMAKNAIGLAIATEEYGSKFFANGATPGGVLEHPNVVKDPERVRTSWNAAFGGSANANKVAVLEEGMKYTPISISPEQAQFLETRKFQIDEIWSFNTGRVQAKMGVNEKPLPSKTPVSFVLLDNHHLTENGVRYFCARSKQAVVITSNPKHPAFSVKEDNLHIILQEQISLKEALEILNKDYGCDRLTVQSGGTVNGLFLREKLFDFVDVIVAPILIGGKDTSTLIDGQSLKSNAELSDLGVLKLIECSALEDSYIRLRYQVIG